MNLHRRRRAMAAGPLLLSATLAVSPCAGKPADQGQAPYGAPRFTMLLDGIPAPSEGEAPARAGDTARIFLHNREPRHYAVYYRDDGGPWELYFASDRAAPPAPRGAALPHALLLDTGWTVQEIAALAGAQPPGAAARDCLPPPVGVPAVSAPYCRDIALKLFRLRNSP